MTQFLIEFMLFNFSVWKTELFLYMYSYRKWLILYTIEFMGSIE